MDKFKLDKLDKLDKLRKFSSFSFSDTALNKEEESESRPKVTVVKAVLRCRL